MPLLLDHLLGLFPASKRQTLKRMVEAGRVTVNGVAARKLKHPLAETDVVKVLDRPSAGAVAARPGKTAAGGLRIIHEDADVLVVEKPAGLLTSTVPREPRPTLIALVRAYLTDTDPKGRAGVIHRLDREASGVLVFSKNDEAYRGLKRQFFKHTVGRTYAAVVEGVPAPPTGEIDTHLAERADGFVYSTAQPGKGRRAVTHYEVVGENGRRALLRVRLLTGRKHQIRAHLSERGTPLVGDPVYGRASVADAPLPSSPPAATVTAMMAKGRYSRAPAPPPARLLLSATHLAFTHPRSGERLTFDLPTPPEMEAAMRDVSPPAATGDDAGRGSV